MIKNLIKPISFSLGFQKKVKRNNKPKYIYESKFHKYNFASLSYNYWLSIKENMVLKSLCQRKISEKNCMVNSLVADT